MKFAVLGPLTVSTRDGAPVAIGGSRQRTLLAMLLFHAGNPIPVSRLVDTLWDGAPPKSHLSNLHTYIARLRERLVDVRIDHHDGQYLLRLPPGALDLHVFQDEAEAGRKAIRQGDPVAAAAHFRHALAQWRDRPLLDLAVQALEPDIAQLEAARVNVVEEHFDAELAAGRAAEIVGELQSAVAEHPMRERLCGQLMTALCGAGRQADALAVYRTARDALVEAVGVEPGPDLQQLHQEILRGEAPLPVAAIEQPTFPICQLPPDIADFSGRQAELDELANALRATTSTVPVVVLTGEPGIGKTALAMRVAHRLRADFPDGQLFLRLGGSSRGPKESVDLLAGLLRATGTTASAIPDDPEERAAMFRARLADRRVLLVLDDASSPGQVRPLLPGTPGCAVLVIGRRRLSGLAGARPIPVLPLTNAEAHLLLERVAGRARIAAEPEAAREVVAMCGNLPLALRIAATRLATRPHLSLGFLAKRLHDEHRRLDELAVSGLQVRTSLTLSYQGLTPAARTAFRRLDLLGPRSVPGWTIAVLLDAADADGVVEELVEASLLEPAGQDATGEARYRLHDMLRVYGRERSATEDTTAERLLACKRLVATALALADSAARRMPRTFLLSRLAESVAPPGIPRAAADDLTRDPVAWFTAERANLIGMVRLACANGWHREAALLTERLNVPLWSHSAWSEMRALQEVLREAGDDHTSARADFVLALIDYNRGRYGHIAAAFERCGDTFERLDDRHGLACVLSNQAHFLALTGDPEGSLHRAERAIDLFRAEDDGFGEAAACRSAAIALGRLGRLPEAVVNSERALVLARSLNEPRQVALALSGIAFAQLLMGNLSDARTAATASVELFRTLGERSALASTLHDLGLIKAGLGHRDDAASHFEESGRLAVEIDERPLEAATTRALAAAWIGEGRAAEAVRSLHRGLDIFRQMAAASEQAITVRLLAIAHDAAGEPDEAETARAEADRLDDRPGLVADVKFRALLALTSPTGQATALP